MMPFWNMYSGLASTLAPQSRRRVVPPLCSLGNHAAIAGLLMPLILPSVTRPPARSAPVLPAEISASASPDFMRLSALTIVESFFLLTAIAGASSLVMTSVASITSIFEPSHPFSLRQLPMSSSGPIIETVTSGSLTASSFAALIVPFTIS